MNHTMAYLERVLNFPPVLVRLLARRRYGAPLTTEEIALASGALSSAEVEAISRETSWRGIRYDDALAFQRGCGIEFHKSMRRVNDYLAKRPSFQYLRTSPDWESYYKPLLVAWRRAYPASLDSVKLAPSIAALVKRLTILAN
jgi:hypothetical protein